MDTTSSTVQVGNISGSTAVGIGQNVIVNVTTQSPPAPKPGSAPPLPTLVIGREDDLHNFKARLGITGEGQAAQVLTAIRGWPGIGKTTIAAVLAHDPKDVTL